ncbi:MAG: hypothetical protein HRT66_08035 [Flavobacteriaceae bacterium]|nr:hypothetical protein [Flavobacteriaceae bacterium]
MKKIIIVVFLLMFVSEIYSQEEQYPKHEVNLGMFNVIAYGTFSADYQYIIHEEISVGMELYYGNKSEISYSYDRYASIFARQYFGDKYASGFFFRTICYAK